MSSEPDPTRAVTRGSGRVVIVTGRSGKFFVGYPVLPVSFCVDTRYIYYTCTECHRTDLLFQRVSLKYF